MATDTNSTTLVFNTLTAHLRCAASDAAWLIDRHMGGDLEILQGVARHIGYASELAARYAERQTVAAAQHDLDTLQAHAAKRERGGK